MLRKKKIPPHKKYRQRTAYKPNRFIDLTLIGLSAVVVLLLGSTAIRFVRAETKVLPQQISIVRTQIANGCGESGAAADFAEFIKKQGDDNLKFDVIDVTNFSNSAMPRTMILIRDPGVAVEAERIARRLGIDPDDVVTRELEDNFLSLDITVVVGRDYDKLKSQTAVLKTDILNGCGIKGAAMKFGIVLKQMSDDDIEFLVGDQKNWDSFDVKESLLLVKSRKAEKVAPQVAKALNIKKENVILDNPERSPGEADIAIVVGRDWGHRLSIN